MTRIWLPPIETCCDECRKIVIHVTCLPSIGFQMYCPTHGYKYLKSPFSKSIKMDYEIRVSEEAVGKQQTFIKDLSPETIEKREKFWKNKHELQKENKQA